MKANTNKSSYSVDNCAGFGVIEIVLVATIVVLLGAVGWLVYKDQHKTANNTTLTTTSSKSASTKPASTTIVTKSQAGETYLEDIAATNNALSVLITQEDSWTSKVTGSQAEQEAQPSVKALQALEGNLAKLASTYPPANADLKTEITDAASIVADLQKLTTLSPSTAQNLRSSFISDSDKLQAQANVVRADLGLPATSSTQ